MLSLIKSLINSLPSLNFIELLLCLSSLRIENKTLTYCSIPISYSQFETNIEVEHMVQIYGNVNEELTKRKFGKENRFNKDGNGFYHHGHSV